MDCFVVSNVNNKSINRWVVSESIFLANLQDNEFCYYCDECVEKKHIRKA